MQGMRDLGNALIVALISVGLMIGALSISLVEFVPEAAPTAAPARSKSPNRLTRPADPRIRAAPPGPA